MTPMVKYAKVNIESTSNGNFELSAMYVISYFKTLLRHGLLTTKML